MKNVLTLLSGTVLAQIIPILASPVLTRLYKPEDFGQAALFLSIVSVLLVISNARYEQAIILAKDYSELKAIIKLCLLILACVSILSLVVIVALFFLNMAYGLWIAIPMIVLLMGLITVLDRYNNRCQNYQLMSRQRLVKSGAEALISILIGYFFCLSNGLIFGLIIGVFVSMTIMVVSNRGLLLDLLERSVVSLNSVATKYMDFPKYNLAHALLNTMGPNLIVMLIPIVYGTGVLGYYAFGIRMVQAPLSLISFSLFNVFSQKIATKVADGESVKSDFKKMIKNLIMAASVIGSILVFSPILFSIIFGDEWALAGKYVVVLLPVFLLSFILSPLAILPQINKKQNVALIFEIFTLLARSFPIIFALFCGDTPFLIMLVVISILTTLVMMASGFWYISLIKRLS